MRKILYIGILLFANLLTLSAQEPEQVKSIVKVSKPHEWYVKQAELWKKEIDKNPKSENAWYNYFMADRYATSDFFLQDDSIAKFIKDRPFLMNQDSLAVQCFKTIPNTFTGNYVQWRKGGAVPENFHYLEKAYALNPNFEGINVELIVYYETQLNREKRKYYNNEWFKLNELSPFILNYNYNVLMSVKENGLLLTFGDNDTFPIWVLQDVQGVRQDVTCVNVNLLRNDSYRSAVFSKLNIAPLDSFNSKESDGETVVKFVDHIIKNRHANQPLFVGLGSWKEFDKYPNMYLEGLVLEYSTENVDNIASLQDNFENKYRLDYITNRFISEESSEIVNGMNVGYLAGIFKLYDHYKKSGDLTRAQNIKELGLAIGSARSKELKDWVIESLK